MTKAKFSTNGSTWTTATFNTTAVSGNFIDIVNANFIWGALTSNGQLWRSDQATDSLGTFNVSSSYPTGLKKLSPFNNNFFSISNTEFFQSSTLNSWTTISPLWTTVASNIGTGTFISIKYGNGLWVATSTSILLNSTNGSTWTSVTSNIASGPWGLAYGNGLWVAGGNSGEIRTSTNGSTWTTVTSNFGTRGVRDIAYGNGVWVAVGDSGTARRSTDGSTWTTVTPNVGTDQILGIKNANNLWVMTTGGSNMRTSTDGSTWTIATSNFGGQIISSVDYGNNLWVATGYNGQIRTSTDTITWTTVTSNFGTTLIKKVAYGNGLWIAVGFSGQMRTSTNGSTWTTVNSNFGASQIWTVSYGNGLWIGGGEQGQARTSTQNSYQLNNVVILNNSADLVVANSGALYKYNSSTTGWDLKQTGINDNFINGSVNSSGVYTIVGQNAMYNSTDLINWTTITIPAASTINDIIAK